MVRFIHTADWQMGMKLASLGEVGKAVREERFAAAQRVVQEASARGVDFILVAGDLFEDNAVDRAIVRRVTAILGEAPCPVLVIPGNHDPLVPGSLWEDRSWEAADNVVVFRERAPYILPGVTIYPCPLKGKQSDEDPTAWIEASGEGVQIGLAHGSVEGAPISEWDHPIPRDAARRSGLDYLALGHWHSFGTFGEEGGPVTAYSGTHEPTSFGERDSGNVLLVEIARRGEPAAITPIRTGGISWVLLDEKIDSGEDLARLLKTMRDLPNPSRTLVRVRLSGFMRPDDREALEEILTLAETNFLWGEGDFRGLVPAPGDDRWVQELPEGLLRKVGEGVQGSDESVEVRTQALLELYGLLSEVEL